MLFGVPNGQTSVERAFSSLDFIYDRRRCNLSADNLNNILMIRLNPTVLDDLSNNDWDEILTKIKERDTVIENGGNTGI